MKHLQIHNVGLDFKQNMYLGKSGTLNIKDSSAYFHDLWCPVVTESFDHGVTVSPFLFDVEKLTFLIMFNLVKCRHQSLV